ncbi:MAG: fatty acid desaturase [Deltaproteobacteria bacterium]|nr:fatty acid desaturase [Deltaproteobacteria bacterium]
MSMTPRFTLKRFFGPLPFLLVHLVAALAFFTGFEWHLVALMLGSYWLRMVVVTMGYHRYFSHRSFKTGRVFQFLLAFGAQTSAQKGVLWWASHHRAHHAFSDTERDIHSPVRKGFWWSHVGWILSTRYDTTDEARIRDFARYPELVFLNRWPLLPAVVYAAAILAIWGWSGLLWGFFLSTVLLYHGTFFINSLAHVFGRRRFPTSDTSRNSLTLALITSGEGWHNNHHYFQAAARQGFYWWQIDVTWYVLKLLALLRVVSDLREPPQQVLELGRQRLSTKPVLAPPLAPESRALGLSK